MFASDCVAILMENLVFCIIIVIMVKLISYDDTVFHGTKTFDNDLGRNESLGKGAIHMVCVIQ